MRIRIFLGPWPWLAESSPRSSARRAGRRGHGDAARTAQARWLELDLPGAAAAPTEALANAAA